MCDQITSKNFPFHQAPFKAFKPLSSLARRSISISMTLSASCLLLQFGEEAVMQFGTDLNRVMHSIDFWSFWLNFNLPKLSICFGSVMETRLLDALFLAFKDTVFEHQALDLPTCSSPKGRQTKIKRFIEETDWFVFLFLWPYVNREWTMFIKHPKVNRKCAQID